MEVKHIPSRYFSNKFSFSDRMKIAMSYSDKKWDLAKSIVSETNKISQSAIEISENMKTHLGLNLFPCIKTIATKGFDISGGTHAFMMIDDEGDHWFFDTRARHYKAKKGKYKIEGDLIYRI